MRPPISASEAAEVSRLLNAKLGSIQKRMTQKDAPIFGGSVNDLLKFESFEYEGVRLTEDGKGTIPDKDAKAKMVISFVAERRTCNGTDNCHGGFLGWVVDFCTSMAMVLLTGPVMWQVVGVSSNINVHYVNGVPLGTKVIVTSTVINKGFKTATIRAELTDAETGKLYVVGVHAMVDTSKALLKNTPSMALL